ncbi:unnamed protein product [Ambrosiozyma monospora]|uniref:Unnamed protein product n=1 Tax=Ambrosiozyma monospora TaxID=43982 RepID=A0ACB5TA92_AMBMO|nr:unnamed protein product [Ambrosiozyma monospora]
MSSFKIENIYEIAGRQAIVTGGGSGIGQMICKGFAANNVDVAIVDLFQDRLDETAKLCEEIKLETGSKSKITTLCYDLGNEVSNKALVNHWRNYTRPLTQLDGKISEMFLMLMFLECIS